MNIDSEMSLRELDKALLTSSVYNILYKYGPKKQEEIKLLAECVTNFVPLSYFSGFLSTLSFIYRQCIKAIKTDFLNRSIIAKLKSSH